MTDDEGPADDRTVQCETHGTRTSTIVCCHLLRATDRVLGFVEDRSDPDDPVAWCNDCEQLYVREQEWTDALKQFADLKVVCDACYARLKKLHSAPRRYDSRGAIRSAN